jgi:hypothetical protein
VDNGSTSSCIDQDFVKAKEISVKELAHPIPVYNADGSPNSGGLIKEYAEFKMDIGGHSERIVLAVTNLGKMDLVLGMDWLHLHNPLIDWTKGSLSLNRCPPSCNHPAPPSHDTSASSSQPIHTRSTIATELAIKELDKNAPPKTFEELVPSAYHDYRDIFDKAGFDKLPDHQPWDHAIDLEPDAPKSLPGRIYSLTREEEKEQDAFLDEHLTTGRIRPSKSPIASPFFFRKKKDGRLRPIQDYRRLNNITIKNKYPIPLIQSCIDKLKRMLWFTKLDVRWGFNNVRIKEGDEWKAAFITSRGLFEPTVMFFGLCNSPATFQSMMDHILRDEVHENFAIVYLDDILIFSKDLTTHRQQVRRVLEKLRQHHLSLKAEKCSFERNEVEYVGVIVGNGQVRMDPVKIRGIADWPIPPTRQKLQSFLGFCNFYRRFVKDYSLIARPLHDLTKKDVKYQWTAKQQKAFEDLKGEITRNAVLLIPVDDAPFKVEADASDYAVGAVLSQRVENKWRPVAFLSKSLGEAERNYPIYDKEMLAIMTALTEWRHYLLGAPHTVEVHSDHNNLQYFRQPQKINRRQARWVTELADYDIKIHHCPGRLNAKADALSRRDGHNRGEHDNENITVLPNDIVIVGRLQLLDDSWFTRKIEVANEGGRLEVIRDHHDTAAAGHPGRDKTYELVSRHYFWPGMRGDIERYVAGCDRCQRTKAKRQKASAPLHPNEIPSAPWEIISVDLIGPLPQSQGYDTILVVVDRFTKMTHLVPTNKELSSLGTAKIFRDHVFRHHGLPKKVISDRGTQFVSKFMKALYKLIGITGNPSTAYHPQTDGQTERINQEVEQYLRLFVNHRQDDWADWLACAEFAYNNHQQSATTFSPFFLNYGHHPSDIPHLTNTDSRAPAVSEFVSRMQNVRQQAKVALEKAAETMKRYYDRSKRESQNYKPGALVFLEGTNLTTDRPTKKLGDKRYGPFKVLQQIGRSSYKLALPRSWSKVHPVFNEILLTPYRPPVHGQQPPIARPPPILIDDTTEYEVEEIVDSRVRRGRLQYCVKWKGYPYEERTWEPVSNLEHAKNAISDFHKNHPSAPRPINTRLLRFIPMHQFTDPPRPPPSCPLWEDGKVMAPERHETFSQLAD